jgi:hypothetical protein
MTACLITRRHQIRDGEHKGDHDGTPTADGRKDQR